MRFLLSILLLLILCGAAFGGAAPGWPPPSYVIAHQWQNVKDYGAKGDGTTDDLAAFQNAVTAAGNGGIVFVPSGTFVLSDTLVLGDSIILCGVGVASVIKADSGHNENIITITGKTGVVIRDLMIDGNNANNDSVRSAIIFEGCTDFMVSGVTIIDMYGQSIGVGTEGNPSSNFTLEYCIISGGTSNHIDINSSQGGKILYNKITGAHGGEAGIFLGHSKTHGHLIQGNEVDSANWGVVLDNTVFSDSMPDVRDIRIIGNYFSVNQASGIALYGAQHCLIADNTCVANNRGGVSNGSGIYLADGNSRGSSYNSIVNNICYDSTTTKLQAYGLYTSGLADSNTVLGNNFGGNLIGTDSLAGSHNIFATYADTAGMLQGNLWVSSTWAPEIQTYNAGQNAPLIIKADSVQFKFVESHGRLKLWIGDSAFSTGIGWEIAGPDGFNLPYTYMQSDTTHFRGNVIIDSPLTIGAYKFPIADGTAGYVLETDGSGQMTWQPNDTSGTPQIDTFYIFFTDSASAANGNRHVNGILKAGDTLYVDTTLGTIDSFFVAEKSQTDTGWKFPGDTIFIDTTVSAVSAGGWTDDGNWVRLNTVGDSVAVGQATGAYKFDVEGWLRSDYISVDSVLCDQSVAADYLFASGHIRTPYLVPSIGDHKLGIGGGAPAAWDDTISIQGTAGRFYRLGYDPDSVFITLNHVQKIAGDSGGGGGAGGWTDDGAKVRLTTVGDSVGIGTATPTKKLHVVGPSFFNGAVTFGGIIDMDDYFVQNCGEIAMAGNGTVDGIDVSKLDTALLGYPIDTATAGGSNNLDDGEMLVWNAANSEWRPGTTGGGAGGWTDDGTVVRLTAIGDSVGIGTTTPTANLHVNNEIRTSKLTVDNYIGIAGNYITELVGPSLDDSSGILIVKDGGVDLTVKVTGVLPDGNIADNLTADNYLPLVGGPLTGPVTTTSTFDGKDVSTLTDIGQTVESAEITDGTALEADLNITNAPTGLDGYLLSLNEAGGNFTWVTGGAGETNTLGDTGTFDGASGFGLAGGKTGTVLKVKGLIEGSNITIAASGDSAYTITGAAGGFNWQDSAGEPPFWVDSAKHADSALNADSLGHVAASSYITDSKFSDSSITLLNATAWRLFYSNATTTAIQELILGSDGTYLKSNGASSAPTWASVPAGIWTEKNDSDLVYIGTDTIIEIRADEETTFVTPGDNTVLVIGDEGLTESDSLHLYGYLYFEPGTVLDSALLDSIHDGLGRFAGAYLPLAGGQMTGNITMAGAETVDGRDLSADGSKLDGIESAADVTDATNVNAAGAVMESDFNATTFLYATTDNTPQPKTPAETRAILNVEDGATADQTFVDSAGNVTDQTIDGNDVDSTSENFVFDDPYKGTSAVGDSVLTTRKELGDTSAAVRGDFPTGLTNQGVKGDHVDSTSEDFVFDNAYEGTSAVADSQYSTHNWVQVEIEDSLNEYSLTSAISSTYEVQLNNEAGLYGVLSDVSDFVQPGDAAHDGFSDFVANEHIDWTSDQGATNIHSGNYAFIPWDTMDIGDSIEYGVQCTYGSDTLLSIYKDTMGANDFVVMAVPNNGNMEMHSPLLFGGGDITLTSSQAGGEGHGMLNCNLGEVNFATSKFYFGEAGSVEVYKKFAGSGLVNTVGDTSHAQLAVKPGHGIDTTGGAVKVDTADAVVNAETKPVTGNAVYDFCETTQDYLKTSENSDWNWDDSASDGALGPYWVDSSAYATDALDADSADHADTADYALESADNFVDPYFSGDVTYTGSLIGWGRRGEFPSLDSLNIDLPDTGLNLMIHHWTVKDTSVGGGVLDSIYCCWGDSLEKCTVVTHPSVTWADNGIFGDYNPLDTNFDSTSPRGLLLVTPYNLGGVCENPCILATHGKDSDGNYNWQSWGSDTTQHPIVNPYEINLFCADTSNKDPNGDDYSPFYWHTVSDGTIFPGHEERVWIGIRLNGYDTSQVDTPNVEAIWVMSTDGSRDTSGTSWHGPDSGHLAWSDPTMIFYNEIGDEQNALSPFFIQFPGGTYRMWLTRNVADSVNYMWMYETQGEPDAEYWDTLGRCYLDNDTITYRDTIFELWHPCAKIWTPNVLIGLFCYSIYNGGGFPSALYVAESNDGGYNWAVRDSVFLDHNDSSWFDTAIYRSDFWWNVYPDKVTMEVFFAGNHITSSGNWDIGHAETYWTQAAGSSTDTIRHRVQLIKATPSSYEADDSTILTYDIGASNHIMLTMDSALEDNYSKTFYAKGWTPFKMTIDTLRVGVWTSAADSVIVTSLALRGPEVNSDSANICNKLWWYTSTPDTLGNGETWNVYACDGSPPDYDSLAYEGSWFNLQMTVKIENAGTKMYLYGAELIGREIR